MVLNQRHCVEIESPKIGREKTDIGTVLNHLKQDNKGEYFSEYLPKCQHVYFGYMLLI